MRGADREMLGDEIDEEHEEAGDDEAGVEVLLRRALLALPGLHLADAHGSFLLHAAAAPRSVYLLATGFTGRGCLLLKLAFLLHITLLSCNNLCCARG